MSATKDGQDPSLDALEFPVLCFNQGLLVAFETMDELTQANKRALKNGWFDGLLVIGSNLIAIRMRGARKLHGIGRMRGYNVFLEQRIRVALEPGQPPTEMVLADVKKLVRESFRQWHGWSSRGDFEELQSAVEQAQSADEIIHLLKD